jgi:hypothetical protein
MANAQNCDRCTEHLVHLVKVFIKNTSRMPSYRILRRVAVVKNDVSEERSVSIIRMTRIGELRTTLAATNKYALRNARKHYQIERKSTERSRADETRDEGT